MALTKYKLKVKLSDGTIQSADIYNNKPGTPAELSENSVGAFPVKCPDGKIGWCSTILRRFVIRKDGRHYIGFYPTTKARVKYPDGRVHFIGYEEREWETDDH